MPPQMSSPSCRIAVLIASHIATQVAAINIAKYSPNLPDPGQKFINRHSRRRLVKGRRVTAIRDNLHHDVR